MGKMADIVVEICEMFVDHELSAEEIADGLDLAVDFVQSVIDKHADEYAQEWEDDTSSYFVDEGDEEDEEDDYYDLDTGEFDSMDDY